MNNKKQTEQEKLKSDLINKLEELKETSKILNIPIEKPNTEEQQRILNEISENLIGLNKYINENILKIDSIIEEQKNNESKLE